MENTQQAKPLHLFKSNIPSSRYIFKSGAVANFTRGIYTTSAPKEIEELHAEINAGHPHIFVDKEQLTISADELDPVGILKKKLKEEILAEMAAAAGTTNRDMGTSAAVAGAGLVTSSGIAGMAAGSASGASSPISAGSIKVGSASK